ncbi:MAG: ABC transporter permease [Planctomycetes bacterium]|nr:ABC transporter permease [Planctomycetota bacterium]
MARLALAYLIRRLVQILAVFGVAIGLLALLVVLAVMNGLIEEDRASVRGPLSDLLLIPGVGEASTRWKDYQSALDEVPEIAAAAPHLVVYALLATDSSRWQLQQTSHGDSNAVQLVGIDPELEALVTPQEGGWQHALANAETAPIEDTQSPFTYEGESRRTPGGAIISDRLRFYPGPGESLRGSELKVVALPNRLPEINSEETLVPVNGSFRIAGTYAGSDYEMSLDRIYVPRTGWFKGLYGTLVGTQAADVSEVMIRLKDGIELEVGRIAVMAALNTAGLPAPTPENGGALETWEERQAVFLSAIENERRVTTLVMFFIVVVAAFGIFATLSALVREKVRDLGVLASLGFSPLRRGSLLLFVGSLGSGAGALLGYFGAFWIVQNHVTIESFLQDKFGIEIFDSELYVIDGIPVHWDPSMAIELTVAAFLVGVIFTLGPAFRAASLSPIEALRYE